MAKFTERLMMGLRDLLRTLEATLEVAEAAARSPFPDWDVRADQQVPGSPSFVTPMWFIQHLDVSKVAWRRINDTARRKKRATGRLAWWPDEGVAYNSMHWAFARASCTADDLRDFSRIISACTKHFALGPIDPDGGRGVGTFYRMAFFGSVEYSAAIVHALISEGEMVDQDPDMRETFEFVTDRYPDALDMVDKRLARPAPTSAAPVVDVVDVDTELATDEIEALPAADEPAFTSDEDPAAVLAERDMLQEELADISMRYADLQRELAAVRAGHDPRLAASHRGEHLPSTMAELVRWIDEWLPPTVHVTTRALRSLRKAEGCDVERIARGLRFLRDTYVPYRCDAGLGTEDYAKALAEAGFQESAALGNSENARHFRGYTADWEGGKVTLDRHLKRGIGTDPKVMIRIYFHWDRSTRTVVVGHLPGHLDNWATT